MNVSKKTPPTTPAKLTAEEEQPSSQQPPVVVPPLFSETAKIIGEEAAATVSALVEKLCAWLDANLVPSLRQEYPELNRPRSFVQLLNLLRAARVEELTSWAYTQGTQITVQQQFLLKIATSLGNDNALLLLLLAAVVVHEIGHCFVRCVDEKAVTPEKLTEEKSVVDFGWYVEKTLFGGMLILYASEVAETGAFTEATHGFSLVVKKPYVGGRSRAAIES
jgi:hypothetical protein